MDEHEYIGIKTALDNMGRKLDTIDHNVLAAVSRLDKLQEISTIPADITEGVSEKLDTPNTKHMSIGINYLGMHEVKDKNALVSFLGIDPHTTYWCAYYATACYKKADMKYLAGVAHEYTSILNKIDEPYFGCACVWKNHIAFFYGYADRTKLGELEKYGKVNSLEDWEKVKCEKDDPNAVIMVMGGNQSDMCNISPKYFYDNYTEFDGYYENVG